MALDSVCADLQLHEVSQSLHVVQVDSGLTNEEQTPLLPHLTFNPEGVRQHGLQTHLIITVIINVLVLQEAELHLQARWVAGRADGVARQFGSVGVGTFVEDQLTRSVLKQTATQCHFLLN